MLFDLLLAAPLLTTNISTGMHIYNMHLHINKHLSHCWTKLYFEGLIGWRFKLQSLFGIRLLQV